MPLAIKTDCSPWCVSTTAEWTAKPAEQPCPAGTGQLPEFTESRIKDDRQLKQGVKEGTKEDGIAADQNVLTAKREHQCGRPQKEKDQQTSNELQARLSACQALEPIPEIDGYCVNDDTTAVIKEGKKPKALPLSASKAVKQGLAKIAALGATSKHAVTGHNGSKPVPTRSDDIKAPKVASGIPIQGEQASTDRSNAPRQASYTEQETPGRKSTDPSRRSIKAVQRSRSAGHPPLTPNRKSGLSGNSRSCPPARLKSSPIKEVIKSGRKTRKDVSPGIDYDRKDNHSQRSKQSGPPLRRAGLDTSRKLDFFTKPDGMPKQSEVTSVITENGDGDTLMIDVESIIAADEIRKQAIAVEQVRDASSKWLTDYPNVQKNAIEQLAVRFLLTMNSTLCFFTVAMRMLSKAPWTESMGSIDVRQSALVAISRGWFVKNEGTIKYPFTRAELALAAGVYEGLLTPTLPDDTTVALRTIIDHLPRACDAMFSRAEVTCPFCHAKSSGIVPTFSSCISWKDQAWCNLKQALSQAQPFVGYLPRDWHAEGCNRDDQNPKLTKLGKWLYLELRPYPVLRNDFFPFLSESISLISDDSLCTEGLYVDCLVCSNLSAGESRHYWLVEVSEGRIQHAYDSLQGVQPLTQEVYRMLQVTGALLRSANCGKPVLKNLQLEQKAGKIEAVVRRAPAIKVTSRSRTCKTKRELVKSMNKLSIAPTKLNFFSKKLGKKVEGLNAELASKTTPSHLILARGPKDRRPHAPSYARKRTKRKAQPKRTQRLGVPVSKTHKGINELLSQPTLHEQGRPKNIGLLVDDSVESVSDGEILGGEAPIPINNEKVGKQDAPSSTYKASDPISDFVTQNNGSGDSPHREKKRTFTQAELEESVAVTRNTEDDLRRKQGPPRAGPGSPILQPEGPDARSDGNQPSVCPERQTNGAKSEHGSKSGREIGKSTDREGECTGRGEPQSSTSGTACCRAQPGQGGGTTNQTVAEPATPAGAFVRGRYGIISLFDGVSSVVPILKKKLGYPPVAVILAECDRSLRQLVRTEFDYRSDEKWGYTPDGSAVLYLRDVNSIIAGHCKVLQDLV